LLWGGEYAFTSALIFDVGVYLAVLAIIIAVINELGGVREREGKLSTEGVSEQRSKQESKGGVR